MFIIQLRGGLGNQMFQYAAAKSLCLKYGVDLFLDHSYFKAKQSKWQWIYRQEFRVRCL
jgi:hypothetical protein